MSDLPSEAPTPQDPHDVRSFARPPANDHDRLVRAEALLDVCMGRLDVVERRAGKVEQTSVRMEERLGHMESKLDQLAEGLRQLMGRVPTPARQAAVVTGSTGSVAGLLYLLDKILGALGGGG